MSLDIECCYKEHWYLWVLLEFGYWMLLQRALIYVSFARSVGIICCSKELWYLWVLPWVWISNVATKSRYLWVLPWGWISNVDTKSTDICEYCLSLDIECWYKEHWYLWVLPRVWSEILSRCYIIALTVTTASLWISGTYHGWPMLGLNTYQYFKHVDNVASHSKITRNIIKNVFILLKKEKATYTFVLRQDLKYIIFWG